MEDILDIFSIHDIKRLESYARNLLDYHVVIDMMPQLARVWFTRRLPDTFELSPAQQLILLGLGLQHKTIDDIAVTLVH
jgi:N-acetyltransferase 10